MKPHLVVGICLVILADGCADREAGARRAREEVDAKARAEAARKEMQEVPKAFQTPDYFKKNEPGKKTEPAAETPKPNP